MVNQNKIFSCKIKRQSKNVFPSDIERTEVRSDYNSQDSIMCAAGTAIPTKWHVRQAKTDQPVHPSCLITESSLCAVWIAKDPKLFHVDRENSDQIAGCEGWSESSLAAQEFVRIAVSRLI